MAEKGNTLRAAALKAAALLPLLLMGAGVWYYMSRLPGAAPAPAGEAFVPQTPAGKLEAQAEADRIPSRLRTAPLPSLTLEVKGSDEFKAQVTDALKLVWEADRDTFLFLKNSIFVIRNGTKTDLIYEDGQPVASISSAHAFRSKTWCAGVIAHLAWHAWYNQKKPKRARRLPPPPGTIEKLKLKLDPAGSNYRGMDALLDMENRAAMFQLEVLRKVRAPRSETDPVFRRAPRDFSAGHDGGYDLKP